MAAFWSALIVFVNMNRSLMPMDYYFAAFNYYGYKFNECYFSIFNP